MKGSEDVKRLYKIIGRRLADPLRGPLLWVVAGFSIPCGYPSLGQLAERLRKVGPGTLITAPMMSRASLLSSHAQRLLFRAAPWSSGLRSCSRTCRSISNLTATSFPISSLSILMALIFLNGCHYVVTAMRPLSPYLPFHPPNPGIRFARTIS